MRFLNELLPNNVSGYFSSVFCHVSNLRPEMLIMSFSSSARCLSEISGGGGSGFVAMGTQPMAAARAKGSHAATEAILLGAISPGLLSRDYQFGLIDPANIGNLKPNFKILAFYSLINQNLMHKVSQGSKKLG